MLWTTFKDTLEGNKPKKIKEKHFLHNGQLKGGLFSFLKLAVLGLFFIYFWYFETDNTNFTTN